MFLFITDNYTQDIFDYLRISLSQKHLSQISFGCTASEWRLELKKSDSLTCCAILTTRTSNVHKHNTLKSLSPAIFEVFAFSDNHQITSIAEKTYFRNVVQSHKIHPISLIKPIPSDLNLSDRKKTWRENSPLFYGLFRFCWKPINALPK